MSRLLATGLALAAAVGPDFWSFQDFADFRFNSPLRVGRKPSGVAASKRAAKRRRNIAKRNRR